MGTKQIIDKVEAAVYTGYLWKSDSPVPEVFQEEEISLDKKDLEANPFIIEGQLFSKSSGKKGVSYSIKNAGGKVIITRYDIAELEASLKETEDYKERSFFTDRIKGFSKMLFREYYRETDNSSFAPEGFVTLEPAEFVFMGFEK